MFDFLFGANSKELDKARKRANKITMKEDKRLKKIEANKEKLTLFENTLIQAIQGNTAELKGLKDMFCLNGVGSFSLNGSGVTIGSSIDVLHNCISNVFTKEEAIEMAKKEIEYDKNLSEAREKYPDMLDFLEVINTSYGNLDKFSLLDTAKMFNCQGYVLKKENDDIDDFGLHGFAGISVEEVADENNDN